MKVSLVILTLNEIVGLKEILPTLSREGVDEVIAVDGGSTDGSIEFMKEHGIDVFVQERRGRGEAFRLAFKKASGDALLFFSPDGNEDAKDIAKFKPLLEAGNDIVVATRMVRGARNEEDDQLLRPRKWANNAFTLVANATWNRRKFITDTINGFRAITREAWDKLKLDGPGYTIEYQSSIRAFKLGLKVAEFPTYEGNRIDDRVGSPSVSTGIAFVRLYLNELAVKKNFN